MAMSEKIMTLRKQRGWSQEELADRLSVTRQSVSKWESGASIPDLDKVVGLSELFGVSTDYLLKDAPASAAAPAPEAAAGPESPAASVDSETPAGPAGESAREQSRPARWVDSREAEEFLALTEHLSWRMAAGVALCILGPAQLLLLLGLAELGALPLAGGMATGVGLVILLLMVAGAVAFFVTSGLQLEPYAGLEEEELELDDVLRRRVAQGRDAFEGTFRKMMVLGVTLCILSAVPLLFVSLTFHSGGLIRLTVALLLTLVACAVFLFVRAGMVRDSFLKLLEEGEYTRENKALTRKYNVFNGIYWCGMAALYLGWSFWTMDWDRTWMIWPVAALIFACIQIALAARNGKK